MASSSSFHTLQLYVQHFVIAQPCRILINSSSSPLLFSERTQVILIGFGNLFLLLLNSLILFWVFQCQPNSVPVLPVLRWPFFKTTAYTENLNSCQDSFGFADKILVTYIVSLKGACTVYKRYFYTTEPLFYGKRIPGSKGILTCLPALSGTRPLRHAWWFENVRRPNRIGKDQVVNEALKRYSLKSFTKACNSWSGSITK